MIPSGIGYAERFLAAQNNEILSNRSAQSAPEDQEFVWERGRKLSSDTNKRRKRQEQKQRKEADTEEKRRQEILELRRLKLKEATEKYQRCRGTKKAVERHNRSSSATRQDFGYSNRELEETLRLLQGSGSIQRFGSQDGLNGRSQAYQQPQQQPRGSGSGATASFLEKYASGSGGSRPPSSASDTRQQQQPQRSPFEQQLADFQQKKWESQQRSMRDFQQVLESTLHTEPAAAGVPQSPEEEEEEEDPLADSLDSARTYDRLIPVSPPPETSAPAAAAAAPAMPSESFESFDSAAALRPELFRQMVEPTRPQSQMVEDPVAVVSGGGAGAETEPRGILKKQTSYSSDVSSAASEASLAAVVGQQAPFSEARVHRLRDSVEISRATLDHQHQQLQLQQLQQDEASRKKSVRFAETLCEEPPRVDASTAPTVTSMASGRPPRPTSGKQQQQQGGRIVAFAPTINNGSSSSSSIHSNGSNAELAACGVRMNHHGVGARPKVPEATPMVEPPIEETPPPPPSPTLASPAAPTDGGSEGGTFFPEPAAESHPSRHRVEICIPGQASDAAAAAKPPPVPAVPSGPGYAALMSKKPPKPYKPQPRPVKVTASTLNRLVAPQGPAAPVPPNVDGRTAAAAAQPPRSGPPPKRTVSDPNLSRRQPPPPPGQPQAAGGDERQYSLDRTPTDQEIDWLWSQVRECLNRSTSSLATESDASVRSAPVPRGGPQAAGVGGNGGHQLLIDGSNLMGAGGSARLYGLPPRAASALLQHRQHQQYLGGGPAGRFLQQHQLLGAQQRRLGLAVARPGADRPPLPPPRAAFNETSAAVPPPAPFSATSGGGGASAPVTESLAEFLANEVALSSVDVSSASSSPRGGGGLAFNPPVQPQSPAGAPTRPGSSVRRGAILRHREQNSPLSLNLMPPSPTAGGVDGAPAVAPAVASRQQHQPRQPSQLSLEEQRLMKSLERLNSKLGSDR